MRTETRRRITLPVLTVAALVASLFVAVQPAAAHGYISSPPSRQANCVRGNPANCGDIIYEPQSVEAAKGSMQCNGGGTRFGVLNEENRGWPATSVGSTVTFTWTLTARHATSTWEYFIGGTRLAVFNDGGAQPGATKTHTVGLGGFTGRQRLLARWNINDTPNAFYSCVDLQIGGGGTPPPTDPPPTDPPPTDPPPAGGTWAPNTYYATGGTVTYGGASYRCVQAHTSMTGWEPPNVPALWARL